VILFVIHDVSNVSPLFKDAGVLAPVCIPGMTTYGPAVCACAQKHAEKHQAPSTNVQRNFKLPKVCEVALVIETSLVLRFWILEFSFITFSLMEAELRLF
jgi:hypothetical protein